MELDQEALSRWFSEKWNHGPCPVCATDLWTPLPRLGVVPNLNPLGPGAINVVPVLLVSCTNCGYMLAINALVAGIVQEPDWSEELQRYQPLEATSPAVPLTPVPETSG
ncbi:MAG TPA: hypothetical protein VGP18_07495 [Solirubrobacteraceae bacterium]|jgi:hypothetical protein|nr:hypothetical protein [Solirubrobacteraceae bacterium]